MPGPGRTTADGLVAPYGLDASSVTNAVLSAIIGARSERTRDDKCVAITTPFIAPNTCICKPATRHSPKSSTLNVARQRAGSVPVAQIIAGRSTISLLNEISDGARRYQDLRGSPERCRSVPHSQGS